MVLFGFRYMFVCLHELCKTFINRNEICISYFRNLFYFDFGGNCFKQKYTCKFNPGKIMFFFLFFFCFCFFVVCFYELFCIYVIY